MENQNQKNMKIQKIRLDEGKFRIVFEISDLTGFLFYASRSDCPHLSPEKIGSSLSHMVPEILGPKVDHMFHQNELLNSF